MTERDYLQEAAYSAALTAVAMGEPRDETRSSILDVYPALTPDEVSDALADAYRDARKQGVEAEDIHESWGGRMKQTDDIAPLIEIAEREFSRLEGNAHAALIELHGFWTKLYGPNEALTAAFDSLDEMRKEFLAGGDDVTAERSSGRSYNILRSGAVIDRVDGALSARDAISKFRVDHFGGAGWFIFTADATIESENGTKYEAVAT